MEKNIYETTNEKVQQSVNKMIHNLRKEFNDNIKEMEKQQEIMDKIDNFGNLYIIWDHICRHKWINAHKMLRKLSERNAEIMSKYFEW